MNKLRVVGTQDDKGVVGILEDQARQGLVDGVRDLSIGRSSKKKSLKHVCHNNEQKRRERVPLPQTPLALDPGARCPVKKV